MSQDSHSMVSPSSPLAMLQVWKTTCGSSNRRPGRDGGDLGTQAPHVGSRRALENSLGAMFFTSKFCGWRTKSRCSCVWKVVISCRVQAMNRPVPGHVDHQEKGQRKMADYVSQARPGTSKKWRCARYSISYYLMVRNHQFDHRLLQ